MLKKDDLYTVSITVNDQKEVVNLKEVLRVENIEADRQECISNMAFWGKVAAFAVEERDQLDIEFRHWLAVSRKLHLDSDAKLAQWKVEVLIEATPEFRLHRERIVEADRTVAVARVLYETHKRKVKMIEAMTFAEGGERRAISGVGVAAGDDYESDPRIGAMADSLTGGE